MTRDVFVKCICIFVWLFLLVVSVVSATGIDDAYTVALLHFDNSTNNGVIFKDEAPNTWTVYSAVTATNTSKFAPSSGAFDGAASYIQTTTNATAFDFADDDFTIDCWINTTKPSLSSGGVQKMWGGAGASDPYFALYNNIIGWHDGSSLHSGFTPIQNKTWYHVVVTRSSGVSNLYVNGISQGRWSDYRLYNFTTPSIGQSGVGGYFRGSIDELRVSRYARWTGITDFTPPTVPYNPSLASGISANATYIRYNDYVQFTDASVGYNITAWDWNFGDGTANSTSQNPLHKYAWGGEATVSLIVTNNTGSKASGSWPVYIVSNAPKVYLDGASINYGIPQNLSLKQNGVFSVDGTLVNVTFNGTRMQVSNVFNSDAEPDATLVATIGSGFVLLNESVVDKTWANTTVALLQFNVTSPTGNSTEPLNIATSSGIFPNSTYIPQSLMTYNGRYTGSITPTNSALTQTFNLYRADTMESMNTVQTTCEWSGVTSGLDSGTDGTFSISSTWGNVNVTCTAASFYEADLYNVGIVGGTTNIYMTPYSENQQLNLLGAHEVTFTTVDVYGSPLPGMHVSAVTYNATTDGTNWVSKLYGIPALATSVNGTTLSGYTDSTGRIVFLMLGTNQYAMSFVNSTGNYNNTLLLYPTEPTYSVHCPEVGVTRNNTLAGRVNSSLPWYSLNNTHLMMGMIYQDTTGCTSDVKFRVWFRNNGTEVHNLTWTGFGTALILDNHTISKAPIGTEYYWQYNATRTC